MNGWFVVFYFYAGEYWREIERLLSNDIKAKSQKAAINKQWFPLITLQGKRRYYREPDSRGHQKDQNF